MTLLDEYRQSIDRLDAALIELLAERFKITQEIGHLKAKESLPEVDPEREESLMERIDALSGQARLHPQIGRAVLRVVIDQVVRDHREIRQRYAEESARP